MWNVETHPVNWFLVNFAFAGFASIFLDGWFLSQPPLKAIAMELGLIMHPNLLLPIWALHLPAFRTNKRAREALGWKESETRVVLFGPGAFLVIYIAGILIEKFLGPGIPYNLPGTEGPIQASGLWDAIGLLLLLVALVALTVVAEETMFRGFIQGQVTTARGLWAGMIFSTLLFGLRHLPANILYAGMNSG